MDASKLEPLKHLLCTSKDFQKIFEHFMDHFGESPSFIMESVPTRDGLLEGTIESLSPALCGGPRKLTHIMLLAVPGTSFIHGGCMLGDRMANVLYFNDIKTGVVGAFSTLPGELTRYSRFSLQSVSRESIPSDN